MHSSLKKGRFGCILYLFAEASRRGKIAGGSHKSITCNGGRAALGFGCDFDASDEQLDFYAAFFITKHIHNSSQKVKPLIISIKFQI
jgi:hypothetical protein